MVRSSKFAVWLALSGALVVLPAGAMAQRDDDDQAGVQEAIRWEKHKQAAADRQARIEEARARGSEYAERSDTEAKPKTSHKKKTRAASKLPEQQ